MEPVPLALGRRQPQPHERAAETVATLTAEQGQATSTPHGMPIFGQLALIAAVPLTAQLPAGFCVFWLSSTAFTATQGEVLRRLDAAPVRPP